MLMANKYSRWRCFSPPLGKRFLPKSPDIPAVYHIQTASPTGIADTDTNKR